VVGQSLVVLLSVMEHCGVLHEKQCTNRNMLDLCMQGVAKQGPLHNVNFATALTFLHDLKNVPLQMTTVV